MVPKPVTRFCGSPRTIYLKRQEWGDGQGRAGAGWPAWPRGAHRAGGRRLYRFLADNRWTRFPWAVVQTFSKAEGALSGSMAYYTSCRCCRC